MANPGRYATFNKQMYLGIIVVLVGAYSSLNGFVTYHFVMISPDKKVPCTISDCASPTINSFVLVVNFSCCLCYGIMWTILKTSFWGNKMGDKATQRIFKSLVMILVVSVMPWAIYIIFKASLTYIKLSPLELWYTGSIIGYGIIFASIADILILYIFSTEYKAAIKRQFMKNYDIPGSYMTHVKSNIKSSISRSQSVSKVF
uniref:Uncharacterized protein n=1 Tax=Ditylenchus dipsaci TaxID=166011 RepID=A0A915EG75_9BILA